MFFEILHDLSLFPKSWTNVSTTKSSHESAGTVLREIAGALRSFKKKTTSNSQNQLQGRQWEKSSEPSNELL